MSLYRLASPLLFTLDAEQAHGLSIHAAAMGLVPHARVDDARLRVTVAGLDFANPLGLAAGYDKGAETPAAMWKTGFGHVEVGTITPQPQPGNPKPRAFRLTEDEAVINRYGFNSEGRAIVKARIERLGDRAGILGINIGANKTSEDFAADYVHGIETFAPLADYLTVNISSPNTPGLRGLQTADALADLLAQVVRARGAQTVPIFVKVAPDLDADAIVDMAEIVAESGVDGIIVSNTTLSREGLRSRHRDEAGGLSGQPLFARSTAVLARFAQALDGRLPIIGVGGVGSTEQALEKLRAGASLVQLYSALVYEGPGLAGRIAKGMSAHCDAEGLGSITEIIGSGVEEWAAQPV